MAAESGMVRIVAAVEQLEQLQSRLRACRQRTGLIHQRRQQRAHQRSAGVLASRQCARVQPQMRQMRFKPAAH
jgi:hypothetical protein